jgi:putative sterol carrier protein
MGRAWNGSCLEAARPVAARAMREMSAMPVRYLSQEWIDQYNAALAGDDAVRAALRGKSATLQMVISQAPQGEIRYWLRIADGGASAGLGDAGDAEVTIRQTYETSTQINKGELDGQKAFMQGKVKISGKMLKMMQLRGPLEKVQTVLNTIDTEY